MVYELTRPSSHSTIRITAIVHNIGISPPSDPRRRTWRSSRRDRQRTVEWEDHPRSPGDDHIPSSMLPTHYRRGRIHAAMYDIPPIFERQLRSPQNDPVRSELGNAELHHGALRNHHRPARAHHVVGDSPAQRVTGLVVPQ